ncbi:MAG: Hsp70 family protein [Rubrivivax sp.]
MIFPGIDLGTTFSLVAHVNAHGQPALFPDAQDANSFRTPSVVYIGREGTLVGQAAEELLDDAPQLPLARFVKAHLDDGGWLYQDHLQRAWSAPALSALILKKLLRDAQTFHTDELGPAVVTVPAQFTDAQRKATLLAARLAGLAGARLIEEPVAAATYYGLDEGAADRTLLVYDFGGGTFDVTLLQSGPQGLFVLATDGVARLGGRHVDEAIMGLAGGAGDAASQQRLRRVAEQAKIKLATNPALALHRQSLLLGGVPLDFVLTRAQFEAVCQQQVDQSLLACERCLAGAGLGWRDVDKIVLTGGSSLLPAVTRSLLAVSGKAAADLVSRQPHQAVAYGAALIAQRLGAGADADSLVRQASGYDLCLRVWDRQTQAPSLETLIPRNTALPARYSRSFFTNREDQTRLVLEFVQRRGEPAIEASLGHFAFGPILAPRRNHPVEVQVDVGSDGLIHIAARDRDLGTQLAHTLHSDGGASPAGGAQELEWVAAARINA